MDDMDTFCNHLKALNISYVHELFHRWGQRGVRFNDLDKHMIDVGERLDTVILRFVEQGLSEEETAARMGIPIDFVLTCLIRCILENTTLTGWCFYVSSSAGFTAWNLESLA